jgi:hypothetical protein
MTTETEGKTWGMVYSQLRKSKPTTYCNFFEDDCGDCEKRSFVASWKERGVEA